MAPTKTPAAIPAAARNKPFAKGLEAIVSPCASSRLPDRACITWRSTIINAAINNSPPQVGSFLNGLQEHDRHAALRISDGRSASSGMDLVVRYIFIHG